MTTQIYKTIGTGGDYATIPLWVAAIPADLVAADQIWTGYLLNQEFTSASAFGTISGKTCDATRYIELTAQPGSSFVDSYVASGGTNPLRYDSTKGASLKFTGASGYGLLVNVPYFRMSRIQMLGTDTSGTAPSLVMLSSGSANSRIDQCILEGSSAVSSGLAQIGSGTNGGSCIATNTAFIQKSTLAASKLALIASAAQVRSCTLVSLGTTLTAGISTSATACTMVNSYVGGVTAPESGTAISKTACFSSASASGYTTVPMSTTTFVNVTAGTHDLRLAAGSALIDAGTTDATVTTGIYGTTRPQGTSYDVGAFEYAAPLSAPAITTQPSSATVSDGGSAAFTAAASGNPTPTYQWSVSADSGSTWSAISGATSASYTASALTIGDSGKQFRCVATNSQGSATTSAATLTVNAAAPTITTHPASQSVVVPATATFTVAATGTAPLSYQWQSRADSGATWAAVSGATASSYTTGVTTTGDTGKQFRCVITNSGGSATSNAATLTVAASATPPSVTAQPSAQTVTAGSTATFTAAFSGTAPITYQWERQPSGGSWSTISGATSASYTTPATTVSGGSANSGDQYRCTATNSAGSITTSAASLTVNAAAGALTITTPPLRNNTGTLLASIGGWTVNVYNTSTGALVLQKTGLSTSAGGVLTITDAALSAGSYAYEPVHATYGRRLPIGAAA